MPRFSGRSTILVALLALAALVTLPALAGAQGNAGAPASSLTIPASQSFSCGAGQTFFKVGITDHGNITQLESPAGKEHIAVAFVGSGYQVCYNTGGGFLTSYDFGGFEAGWGAAVLTSQPNGPNTFPLEITRTSANGAITVKRRFTGNSFVGGASTGGTYDTSPVDGVGCDSLAECGNCTNRTIHVLTTVTNNTGLVMSIRVLEYVDLDISNDFVNDWAAKTADSAMMWKDKDDATADADSRGVLMQSLILPAVTSADPCCGYVGGPSLDCTIPSPYATPIFNASPDAAIQVRQDIAVGGFSSTTTSIRTHLRRF